MSDIWSMRDCICVAKHDEAIAVVRWLDAPNMMNEREFKIAISALRQLEKLINNATQENSSLEADKTSKGFQEMANGK